jgi:hypothetical protein
MDLCTTKKEDQIDRQILHDTNFIEEVSNIALHKQFIPTNKYLIKTFPIPKGTILFK